MRHRLSTLFAAAAALIVSFLFFSVRTPIASRGASREKPDDAWDAFQWWYSQRAFPHELIPQGAFQKAALYAKTKMRKESPASLSATPPWVALGPNNVGGRVLSIAVNPSNTDVVWAGSASGGLWKSTSGGEGSAAWSYVATGFPTLAVSTIAIDPANTQVMYIGTGEISGYHRPQVGTPGARSSYGMGILKSTDGGSSWVQTGLTWTFPQVTAVEKIAINPMHTQTIFAATSEGVFKSTNAGATWFVSDTTVMAMDIAINPSDTTVIYATHGNLNSSPNPGLFQSLDAGLSWLPLTNGIPSTNFGRAVLSISPAQPSRVYVAIANASTGAAYGLYRSDDDGGFWALVSDTNFTSAQGWYDIAVGVKPNDPNRVFTSGLDVFRSTTSGTSPTQQSLWYLGFGGPVPPGGPEGPPNYTHADHHAIVFDPVHPDTVYFGCDGGVFKSTDGGDDYFGCNGGFATTQFYNGFANAFDDSLVAIGGLQDNGVVKYQGSTTWSKVDGGDGGWNAIDPTNNSIMYDEYVYLAMKKSTNGGLSFNGTTAGLPTGSANANFIAPFAISTSSPNVLYAGNKNVYKTTSGGANWFAPNGGANLNGTKLACIGVSYTSPDTLIAGTGTSSFGASPLFQLFASTNGGQSWTNVTGTLPARYPTDIEFDPTLSSTVYVTYSGYGGPHVFRSTNVGQTWTDISGTLPDIPHQSAAVDPAQPNNLYVGTDLGVFHSSNAGASWEDFSTGMVPAMILDLAVSRRNGVLRAATFGNGVFERKLARSASVSVLVPNGGEVWQAGQSYLVQWSQQFLTSVKLEYSTDDGGSWNLIGNNVPASPGQYAWTIPPVNSTHARVRVSDAALTSDASDNSFTLILNPDVVSGWNLVSLRLAPPDPRKSVLFPSASSPAFAYTGSYIVRDSLSPGSGYWLKFNQPGFVTYSGDSLLTDSIPVKTGWNMIGSISSAVGVSSIIENPPAIASSRYFGYGPSGYFVASTISPGGGYWVKTSSDGTLVLQSTSSAASRIGSPEEGSLSWSSLEIVDAADRHQRLYLAREDGGGSPALYEMPPPAPAGTLDARFSSSRMVEALDGSSKEFGLSIVTPAYPVRIGWDMKAEMPEAALLIGDRPIAMVGRGQTTIANGDDRLTIRIGGSAPLPHEFSLEQNYPNPFNPGTLIEYRIPERHAGGILVSLKIYDILGREVATVVNEVKQPGIYREEWTAKNLPSGIYTYRLVAGSFTNAKKMLLIR